jgi:diadenosine tetraphosphatase ApaH/serine/threonine PP2A family protein phosphatase
LISPAHTLGQGFLRPQRTPSTTLQSYSPENGEIDPGPDGSPFHADPVPRMRACGRSQDTSSKEIEAGRGRAQGPEFSGEAPRGLRRRGVGDDRFGCSLAFYARCARSVAVRTEQPFSCARLERFSGRTGLESDGHKAQYVWAECTSEC